MLLSSFKSLLLTILVFWLIVFILVPAISTNSNKKDSFAQVTLDNPPKLEKIIATKAAPIKDAPGSPTGQVLFNGLTDISQAYDAEVSAWFTKVQNQLTIPDVTTEINTIIDSDAGKQKIVDVMKSEGPDLIKSVISSEENKKTINTLVETEIKKAAANYYTKTDIDQTFATTGNVAKDILSSEDAIRGEIDLHSHKDFTEAQKLYVQNQMAPIFTDITDLESVDQRHTGRLDLAEKARASIVAMIKQEVPRYVWKYIIAENKKQHDTIIEHVEQIVQNMNAATSANITNLREGMKNHIRDKGIDLEKRVAEATKIQLRKTLQISRSLSEHVVDQHDLARKH
tara:strand:- start:665 stop:1690 length:1026 start_codon:yes stop_codon:yes gene_type:complete